jgi:serine/threonine protein kinase
MNVSKRLKKGQLQTQIGTPYYMSPEIWHNRPYDSSSDMWSLGCMIYELCALRPPFLGDSFPALKRAIAAGRYAPIPRKYSDGMQRVIRNMLQLEPRQRMTAEQMLRSPEIIPKLYLDGGVSPPSALEAQSFPAMMDTIKVPQNLKHLGNALPKPCYPDVRPNSPGAWVVADRENATEETSPRARVVPPTGALGKENGIPAPILKSVAKDSCVPAAPAVNGADRRLQALRDAGYKVPVQPSEPAFASQPPQMPPRAPSQAAGIPVASYMPQYDGVGGANGPYSRAKYRAPPNLIPAGHAAAQPRGW